MLVFVGHPGGGVASPPSPTLQFGANGVVAPSLGRLQV